jgi:hypothetical protein
MKDAETFKVSRIGASETPLHHGPRRILRSIGAVLAGVIVIFILSLGTDVALHATGIYPPWFQPMSESLFLLATAYRVVYTVLGGYITARLAPNRPMQHALGLGVVGLVLGTAGTVIAWRAGPELGPKWYPLALIATALPCTWLGGKLRVMQLSTLADR